MKAKSSLPEVLEPPQAAPQMEPHEPLYTGLRLIESLVPFLETSDTYPSADDCENLSRNAFNAASNLLELVAWGEESFEKQCGTRVEPGITYAAEGIALHLELMRLATKTLLEASGGNSFARKPR